MGQPWIHQVSAELGRHAKQDNCRLISCQSAQTKSAPAAVSHSGVLGIGVAAAGVADRRHAGGNRGLDADGPILDDDAAGRIGTHPGGELADLRSCWIGSCAAAY